MFDERSSKWIKIYKTITVVLFWLFAGLGVLGGLGDATGEFMDAGMGGDDDGLLDFLVWVILGGGLAFIQLTANMLIIQLLDNVQAIRQALCVPIAEPQQPAMPTVCRNCGAHLPQGAQHCGTCGAPVQY